MEERISSIIAGYSDTVKPLLAEIRVRRGDVPNNFLNEIRALNDHIARCYREGIEPTVVEEELTKAEGHLRRLIYDCFKQLNVYISDALNNKEKKYYSDLWLVYDSGQFWNDYSLFRKNAQAAVIEAKKCESYDSDKAMSNYEKAFLNYRNAEELLCDNKKMLRYSFFSKHLQKAGHFFRWLIITILLSLTACLIGLFV